MFNVILRDEQNLDSVYNDILLKNSTINNSYRNILFGIPKNPPNNLKKIRNIFGMTDKELAEKLSVQARQRRFIENDPNTVVSTQLSIYKNIITQDGWKLSGKDWKSFLQKQGVRFAAAAGLFHLLFRGKQHYLIIVARLLRTYGDTVHTGDAAFLVQR